MPPSIRNHRWRRRPLSKPWPALLLGGFSGEFRRRRKRIQAAAPRVWPNASQSIGQTVTD